MTLFIKRSTWAVIAASTMLLGGCLEEDSPELCIENPPPVPETRAEEVLIVKALDINTGATVPIPQTFVDGLVFVFDENEKLIQYHVVPWADLGKEKLPMLRDGRVPQPDENFHVVVWGNSGVVEDFALGETMEDVFLTLRANDEAGGDYTLCALDSCSGELFAGQKDLIWGRNTDLDTVEQYSEPSTRADGDSTLVTKLTHVIPIRQKNAQLYVTVRGLPDPQTADRYWFKLEKQNNGYSFEGDPVQTKAVEIEKPGVFVANGDFVSEEAFRLIPSLDPNNVNEQTGMALHLMESNDTSGGTDNDLADDIDLSGHVAKDIYGNWIGLYSGQTTNVLIEFKDDGNGGNDIVVRVRVTPWDELYQWSTW